MSFKNSIHLAVSIFLFGIVASFSPFVQQTQAQTGCPVTPTSQNSVTNTVTVSENGTYHMWTRLLAPDTANNSFYLQIDGECAITVGDSSSIPANKWTWVNYQDGITGTPTQIQLTAGDHVIKLTQKEGGVGIDRIFFTQDSSCTPTGTGANCTIINTPTPLPVTYTAGWQPWNGTFDSGNNNWISSTQVITGSDSGTLQSISVYMGSVTTAPNNQMQVGIYADNGSNQPGTFLGSSTTQDITPNSWNTLSVGNVTVMPNTKYWLAFGVNGSTTQFGWYNASGGLSRWKNNVPFGTWPTTFGTPDYASTQRYAIYMTYTGTGAPVPTTIVPTNTPPAPTSTPTPTLPADTVAPIVSITYPTNGATVQRNTTVTIQAQATDNIAVSRVEFYVNGVLKGTDTTAPYTNNWLVPNKRNTNFNLSTKAYDSAGNNRTSSTVTVKTNR